MINPINLSTNFLSILSDKIIANPWRFVFIPSIISAIFISKIVEISTDASLLDDLRPNNQLYQDLKFTEKYFGGVLPFEVLFQIKSDSSNNSNINYIDYLPYLKTQSLLESELKNSRFLSINNLIESSKRLQANKGNNEDEMIKLIIKDNQNSKSKLINIKQNTLRISGLIENKTSNQMEKIYSKLDSLAKSFPSNLTTQYTGTTVVALKNKYLPS